MTKENNIESVKRIKTAKNSNSDSKSLSEKIDMLKVDKFGIILDKDIIAVRNVKECLETIQRELKEELERGVRRNKVFPLDWCFDSIDEIFKKYVGDLK